MNMVTKKLYTVQEKKEYVQLIASRLNRNPESVNLQLIEIPTVSDDIISDLAAAIKSQQHEQTPKRPPTVAETQVVFLKSTEAALQTFKLPGAAKLLRYEAITSNIEPLSLNLVYLSDREVSADARSILIDEIKTRLNFPNARVRLQRVATKTGSITFPPNSTELQTNNTQLLNRIAQTLQRQPNLHLEIVADHRRGTIKRFYPTSDTNNSKLSPGELKSPNKQNYHC